MKSCFCGMLCRGIWQTPTQKQTFRTTSYKTKAVANIILRQLFFILSRRLSFAYCSLIIRLLFAHHSLIVRLLFAHRSLIVRSSFAHRSVRVRANWQIDLLANSLCILLMFSLGLVHVGFRLDLKGCPQGQ